MIENVITAHLYYYYYWNKCNLKSYSEKACCRETLKELEDIHETTVLLMTFLLLLGKIRFLILLSLSAGTMGC